ncbi:MAG: hypothetical protein ACHQ50_01930 [Fimbriimonadales bacterium]
MATVAPSTRDRHLLALRSAIPVLLLGAGTFMFMVPLANFGSDPQVIVVFAVGVPLACCIVYAVRYAIPNRKRWIEPGQVCARPSFAVRAGLGAAIGAFLCGAVLAASIYFDPYGHSAKRPLHEIWIGGAFAGVATGLLVYLFSAVLYLPVRSDEPHEAINLRWFIILMSLLFWSRDIWEEAQKHSLEVALGTATWTMATILLASGLGWTAYSKFVPGVENPFAWRRKHPPSSGD